MTPQLRRGLPPLPERVRKLPLESRGYPIPWFACTLDDGTRDIRVADNVKRVLAVKRRLCWICGEQLGQFLAFVIGPMCAVNRNTAEPPSHRECAEFAVQACPFMLHPKADYRGSNLPDGTTTSPTGLPGNPGATCIWITRSFKPYRVPGSKEWLINIGDPVEVQWWSEGKRATRARIMEALDARLPILRRYAELDGAEGLRALDAQVQRALLLLPA